MFQNILRSISGSLSEFAKWEPTADRSEAALRGGLEKSVLFLLCSSAIMGVAALMLGITQQTLYCDRGLAFWNGLLGAILLTLAAACSAALFFDTQSMKLMSKLIWTKCESSFFEYGSTAFSVSACVAACPILAFFWIMRGAVDLTSSPTCRNTAALLYGGTITNITLTISALSFTALMLSYYIATSKGFYDILAPFGDPVAIAVEGFAERLPTPPKVKVHVPAFIPSLDECVAKLPSYEKTRTVVKRIVNAITPVSLPQKFNALMERRVY